MGHEGTVTYLVKSPPFVAQVLMSKNSRYFLSLEREDRRKEEVKNFKSVYWKKLLIKALKLKAINMSLYLILNFHSFWVRLSTFKATLLREWLATEHHN